MRGAFVIALCVTGCFSDRGVAIEVDVGDTGATSVELFIGKDECDLNTAAAGVKCGGIAPMGVTNLLTGKVFFRDAPSEDEAPVKGRTVTFQLKADMATTPPIVIAVGFDQSMQPVGSAMLQNLEVPTNSARIVTTTLVKAGAQQGEDRVVVWGQATSPSSCVAVEHGLSTPWNFVVPSDDVDCDGLPNKTDCNANAYLGSNAGGQASTPDCFAPVGSTCLLGSLGCMDGATSTPGTCAPQNPQHDQDPVCVPSQFCAAMCTTIGPECTQDPIKNAALIPRVVCHVPVRADGAACPGDDSAPIILDPYYGPNAKCDQQPLLGSLQIAALPTNTSSQHFGGALMNLGSPNSPCNFSITWENGIRTAQDPATDYGVIQLQTGGRTTLLPIVFQFEDGTCLTSGQFTCNLAGDISPSDPLWTCAHQQ